MTGLNISKLIGVNSVSLVAPTPPPVVSLISTGKTYTYSIEPAVGQPANYQDLGRTELNDGVFGNTSYGADNIGWLENAVDITFDLTSNYSLDHFRFYLFSDAGGVLGPNVVIVNGSTDNSNWTQIGSFSASANDWSNASGARWSNDLNINGSYRYIKFSLTATSDWLFIQELEIYGSQQL